MILLFPYNQYIIHKKHYQQLSGFLAESVLAINSLFACKNRVQLGRRIQFTTYFMPPMKEVTEWSLCEISYVPRF